MISLDKKYKTRNGREVKIYSVEGNYNDSVHGAILDKANGKWLFDTWNKDGRYSKDYVSDLDLVEVKERKIIEGWVNVYDDGSIGTLWITKSQADIHREGSGPGSKDCFACIKITIDCEEGEGL